MQHRDDRNDESRTAAAAEQTASDQNVDQAQNDRDERDKHSGAAEEAPDAGDDAQDAEDDDDDAQQRHDERTTDSRHGPSFVVAPNGPCITLLIELVMTLHGAPPD